MPEKERGITKPLVKQLSRSPIELLFLTRVREIIKEKGLSGEAVSRMSGLSPEHCRQLLLGNINISLYSFERICRALGLDPSAMIDS